jgi:UDP-glucose 4-epimerase
MKVLVTGGNGFIGRHLYERLKQEPAITEVTAPSRRAMDITNPCSVRNAMECFQPDVVFHLAANSLVKENDLAPFQVTATNVLGTHHLLQSCRPGTRFVFASSATVYGDACQFKWVREGEHLYPTSAYGATKVSGEALVRAFESQGRVNAVICRLVANVGDGATHGLLKAIVDKLNAPQEHIELLGDNPGSIKHYIHVSDTVEALVEFGLNGMITGAINIAPDDIMSVKDVADVVMEVMGRQKPIVWLGKTSTWAGDNKIVRVDNHAAKCLGWTPRYSSRQAVAKVSIGVKAAA